MAKEVDPFGRKVAASEPAPADGAAGEHGAAAPDRAGAEHGQVAPFPADGEPDSVEPDPADGEPQSVEPDPTDREPHSVEPDPADGAPRATELPPRLVAVAYALALLCAMLPLAILGAGFAGAVLIRGGRREAGMGVIAVAVLSTALGIWLLRA